MVRSRNAGENEHRVHKVRLAEAGHEVRRERHQDERHGVQGQDAPFRRANPYQTSPRKRYTHLYRQWRQLEALRPRALEDERQPLQSAQEHPPAPAQRLESHSQACLGETPQERAYGDLPFHPGERRPQAVVHAAAPEG
jgi:hypothetical protein